MMEFTPEIQAMLVAVAVMAARQLLEILGKAIPDSATGLMGLVRQAAKFASGYITDNKK